MRGRMALRQFLLGIATMRHLRFQASIRWVLAATKNAVRVYA